MLYLTSIASNVLDKLIPYLPKKPNDTNVAFIPTAADKYKEKPWLTNDRNKLVELGFKVFDLDIKKYTKEKLQEKLNNADIIFVGGGTTTYLLDKARRSGFDKIVKELVKKGTVYIGASAGSVFAGQSVIIDTVFDSRNYGVKLKSYKGLCLTNFIPIPHANNSKYIDTIKEIYKRFSKKYNLRKINDNQAILINDDKVINIESD